MKNLQAVKDAIVKAVPEIVELKYGCNVVSVKGPRWNSRASGILGMVFRVEKAGAYVLWQDAQSISPALNERFRVVGRPITLEDVLRAMQALSNEDDNRHWVVNRHGQFMRDAIHESDPVLKTYPGVVVKETWHLGKPLHEQSSETIDFIAKILGV